MSIQSSITEHSILHSYLLHSSPLPVILPYSTFLNTCVPSQYRNHPHIKPLYRDLQFQRNIDVDAVRESIERECNRAPALKARLAARISAENGSTKNDLGRAKASSKKRKRTETITNGSGSVGGAEDDQIKSDNEFEDDETDRIAFDTKKDVQASATMLDSTLHPAASHGLLPGSKMNTGTHNDLFHNSDSLLTTLSLSANSVEAEILELDSQISTILSEMTETVGQLSDLRYGRFTRLSGGDQGNNEATVEEDIVSRLKELQARIGLAGHA